MDEWKRCDDHWRSELTSAVAKGRYKLRDTHDAVFDKTVDRLEKEALPLVLIGLLPEEKAPTRVEIPRDFAMHVTPVDAPPPPPPMPSSPPPGGARVAPGDSPWARGAMPSFVATTAAPATAPASTPPPAPVPTPPPVAIATPAPEPAPAPARPKVGTQAMPAFVPGVQMPFVEKPAGEVLEDLERSAPPSAHPSEDLGGTLAIDGEADAKAVPFDGPIPLTLQQYSSVFVELRAYPGREREVLQRYRLPSLDALRAIEAAWKARFDADAQLRPAWLEMCHTYRAWLSRNPLFR